MAASKKTSSSSSSAGPASGGPRSSPTATTAPAPRITNPMVKMLLARPCRLCGSPDHTHFPEIGVAQAEGAMGYRFEMVVCRNCQCVDFFIPKRETGFNLEMLENNRTHRIYRAPPTTAYRG